MKSLADFRRGLNARPRPADQSEEQWESHKQKLAFAKMDEWLDLLEQPHVAKIVEDAIFHFAGIRYNLLAYVVMASHIHWVFQPIRSWYETLAPVSQSIRSPKFKAPREVIMHSLKSFTANDCNRVLGRRGLFWQDESFDHWVRDQDELQRIIEYVELNPVKARLVKSAKDFRYSSAFMRDKFGIRAGDPLLRPT
jgi:type I restriction enzyme R subunit